MDILSLRGTIDRASADRVVVVSHADGTWLLGAGYAFPSNNDLTPNGGLFWRIDLAAFYYWIKSTSTWTLFSPGGGSLIVKEADGAPTVNPASQIQIDSADGLILTDLGGGAVRIDLSGVPEAVLALNFPTHPVVAISAAGASASTGTIVFSNAGNVSFGMAGQNVTATATVASTQGSINLSAGTTSGIASAFTFANAGNVSFGLNANTITATATVASSLTNIRVSAGSTSNLLSALTFADGSGVSWGLNASTITATVKTDYLTSQSNQAFSAGAASSAFQTLSFQDSNQISFSNNAGAIRVTHDLMQSSSRPAFSAGAASSTFQTLSFQDSNNFSFSNNAGQIRANHNLAGTSTGFAGANISGSITNNSSGINLSLSVAAPGAAAENNWFTLTGDAAGNVVGNSSASGSTIMLSARNLTFSGTNNSQILISAPATSSLSATGIVSIVTNGSTISIGAVQSGYTFSSYDVIPAGAPSTSSGGLAPDSTSNIAYFFPFLLDENVSAGFLNFPLSMNFLTVGTSSGRQTGGISVGLYTRMTGTDSTNLSRLTHTSFGWSITGNNSSYTINQYTVSSYSGYGASGATNSAGSNITSGYTGLKLACIPINSLLTPGPYWLAAIGTNSTSSVNVGISASYVAQPKIASGFAPIGSFSTAYTAGGNTLGGDMYVGHGSFTLAALNSLPVSVVMSKISEGVTWTPPILFWST